MEKRTENEVNPIPTITVPDERSETLSDEELYKRLNAIRRSLMEEPICPRCPGCNNEIGWVITPKDSAYLVRAQDLRCLICGAPLRWPTAEEKI